MSVNELIQQYGLWAVVIAFVVTSVIVVWRKWVETNNALRLQQQQMETIRLQMAAAEAKHKQDMETAAIRQREELETESEKRYTRMERQVKSLYEGRLDDAKAKMAEMEAQRVVDRKDVDDLRKRLESMVSELSEQKLLLKAEKRAYAELENFNDALQRNNDNLVKREKELMASEAFLKEQNVNLQRRLDVLEQRISDLEQDNRHKDMQIVKLQDQVLTLKQITVTGENKTVTLPAPEKPNTPELN